MAYISIESETEISPDEYLSNCSLREKKELAELLSDEHFTDVNLSPSTYLETEIVRLFNDIWDSRNFVTQDQLDQIRKKLREERVL